MAEIKETATQLVGGASVAKVAKKQAAKIARDNRVKQIDQAIRNRIRKMFVAYGDEMASESEGTIDQYDARRAIARYYGADYDDGKFWSHNTNPFTFFIKLRRYCKLRREVMKELSK